MQIRNSELCEGSKCRVYRVYSTEKTPLVGENAFPLTGFAMVWFGCSLHLVAVVG